jgi:hypothetical protein
MFRVAMPPGCAVNISRRSRAASNRRQSPRCVERSRTRQVVSP